MPRQKKTEQDQGTTEAAQPPVTQFIGFPTPESNYFRMPSVWIDICAYIDNIAELKVVQYILRHTWGFQEYGIKRRLTIDEFMHGRFKKDGTRMDSGTGLSEQSVRNGLAKALEHGFIEQEVDDTDRARIKKYYSIKMLQYSHNDGEADEEPDDDTGVQTLESGVQSLDPGGANFRPRSQRLTSEQTNKDKPYLSRGIRQHSEKGNALAVQAIGNTQGTSNGEASKDQKQPGRSTPSRGGDVVQQRFARLQAAAPATPTSATRSGAKQQGHWKEAPLFIQAMIEDWFGPELHDQALHSSITRCHRLYQQWSRRLLIDTDPEQVEDIFRQHMQTARTEAKRRNIKKRTEGTPNNPDGHPNRMPYFFSVLEDKLGLKKSKQTQKPPNY